ncbi:phnA protein [Aestuariirhabdus litorea]|uniref:PhnA protein n=1 Tax=Aestuariirhabdus litorea TaxID=2528527 RepID=A0A3P3VNM0_9GAMM|nr:phnA protein [Aestuariirhabdus litorea]RRJ83937.1 phnA protein [Aestuariirhabdus litorea]RWW97159.1 phnA protein [Endozoicomonadaceae bacterium GTF-13]
MAKGLDKHRARQELLSALGKDLARRARSCCELCEASGVKLVTFEVEPVPLEPEFERCLLLCETCREQLANPKRVQPDHWRCLGRAVWSTEPVVQVAAVRMARQLAARHDWAQELLDPLFLEPEVEAWIDHP